MAKKNGTGEIFQTSPLMILLSYTVLCGGLIAETVLMSWELWAIPLIFVALLLSWGLHITQFTSERVRIWIYALLMMASFFFYGIHVTSAYDMSLLMMIIIMIFTTTGEIGIIYICQITYFVTLIYDIVIMILHGDVWNSLVVSRTILHIGLMFLAGWLARTIIRRWALIFGKTDERIAELNESTRRMNSFMANLSHELRTPINAILGITNVMLDKETDKEIRGNMDEVINAGNRMADQVGDILDYSEVEMDNLVVNKGNYMIASVLNDLVSELRPIMPENIELVIDVDADIPAVLKGDATKLRRILYHLINNGLKYTKEGGVYVNLSVVKQDYGVNLCIEITDTGVGMSKDELDRIYNRFYQAESGRVIRSGGLGISMVIVSGFVRALGGFINITSKKGVGTTIRVSIPQEVVDDGRCMVVADHSRLSLGAFLNFAKYKDPNVREFYNKMILNIVRGLKTTMHRVDNVEDLKKLLEQVELTHLFVSDEEYEACHEYLESLAARLQVVVVARDSFELPQGSMAQVMQKPFYCIPVVAILNSDRSLAKNPEIRMLCKGVKALVVDDEPMNLSVAKGVFRRYGMLVKTANSGMEAVEMCRQEDFDVIFMDHMMPGMDGVETMKLIRYEGAKNLKNYFFIALTANALSTAKEMFIEEGFDGFVSKPIELIELERVLKHVLPTSMITYETISIEETEKETGMVGAGEASEMKGLSEESDQKATDGDTINPEQTLKSVGIDVNVGKKFCEFDEELYASLLDQYADESAEKREKMFEYLQAKDLKNYAVIAHALKSTSLMIGAEELSTKAKALELAAKADDISYVAENHDFVVSEYDKVVEAIKRVRAEAKTDEDGKSEVTADGYEDEDEVLEFFPEDEN